MLLVAGVKSVCLLPDTGTAGNAAQAAGAGVLFRAHLDGARPEGVYQALYLVPFPHPERPGLADKFAGMKDAQRAQLLKPMQSYVKVPYINTRLKHEHLRELFAALPKLMVDFRAAVAKEAAEDREPTSLCHRR